MIKRWITACILFLAVFTVKAQNEPFILNGKTETIVSREAWVDSVYNRMSLEEKVGQMFIFTIAPQLNKSNEALLKRVVRDYKIGGLLFSGGEFSNQVKLTNMAQNWADVPLMITFDGEWGLAMRLKNTPRFPRNMVLGTITDESLLFAYGKEMGRQCKEMGVHVNFAPVADVNVNPNNPVINTRSFGDMPQNVASKIVAYSKGLESQNVLSVAKHFPGHGDTNIDSHKALPRLPFNRARLDSIELHPFQALIDANLGGVMVGHLDVPALGTQPGQASSLSYNVVQKTLKDSMGFEGLVFTDALAMRGAGSTLGVCLEAIQAGNDMVLSPPQLKKELDYTLAAVKKGVLSEEFVEERCKKILRYKYSLGLNKIRDIQLSGLSQRLNTQEAKDLICKLELAALTLIKNEGGTLPLHANIKKVALVYDGNKQDYSTLKDALSQSMEVDLIPIDTSLSVASRESLIEQLNKYDRSFICLSGRQLSRYDTYFEVLQSKRPVSFIFFTGGQYLRQMAKSILNSEASILAHDKSAHIQRGVAELLLGERIATGRLAVAISEAYPSGTAVVPQDEKDKSTEDEINYLAEDLGFDTKGLSLIDTIVAEALDEYAFTGCQVAILKEGQLAYRKSFGTFCGKGSDKVTNNSFFDLASLSKTTGTLLAVMKLYDQGKINLTDKVSTYLPELKNSDKRNITIQELLFHESGMSAGISVYDEIINKDSYEGSLFKVRKDGLHSMQIAARTWANPNYKFEEGLTSTVPTVKHTIQVSDNLWFKELIKKRILNKIKERRLLNKRYRYSCLGFILLQQVVENISGKPMDEYLASEFFRPMGVSLYYNPLSVLDKDEIVPSNEDLFFRKTKLQGYVHDETAALLGGVSGNAGQFGRSIDVASVYQMILNGGVYKEKRYLSESTCQLFTKSKSKISRRGLGFDKPSGIKGQLTPCSELAPIATFGHTGFTGTCVWADPINHIVYVFLSNRTYPSVWPNKLSSMNIRERIQDVIYESLLQK